MVRLLDSSMKQRSTRSKSPRRVLKSSLLGYANFTSLHGISYLNDSSLGGGRVILTIVCITGFILTGLYVLRVYHESKENPVLTHIQTTGKHHTINVQLENGKRTVQIVALQGRKNGKLSLRNTSFVSSTYKS